MVFLKETQLLNVLIGLAFISEIAACLALYQRTNKRYVENAMLAKEHVDRYHNLFENSLEAMLIIDEKDGSILDVNRSARELFGYGSEELGEIGVEDLFMTPPRFGEMEEYDMRHMIRKRNGDGVYVEFGNFPVSDRDEDCTVLSLRNIHHRVLAERQLTVNWQRYQRIFDTNALGIQETDLSAIVADLNKLKEAGVTNLETYISENPIVLQDWLGKTERTLRLSATSKATCNLRTSPMSPPTICKRLCEPSLDLARYCKARWQIDSLRKRCRT